MTRISVKRGRHPGNRINGGTKRLMAVICAFSITFGALCGCGSAATDTVGTAKSASGAANLETTAEASENTTKREFTDSVGRVVEVDLIITRIVPSGPLAQMVLFSLAPDKMTALATDWSAEAGEYLDTAYYKLPVLGQLYGGSSDINLEELSKVDPQVVIDVGESKSTIVQDMDDIQNQTGIPCVHIEASLSDMGNAYRMLGDLLGMKDEAETLASYCENTYSMALNTMAEIGDANKKKVVYCVGEDGLYVIAKGSYHAEVLDLIGDNAAVVDNPTSKGTGNEIDMEQLMLWDPDVIIFAPGSIYSDVANDRAWQNLKAIQNKTYYEVPYGPYNWMGSPPSVNRYLGIQWMLKLLYPDRVSYDMYQVTKEYYQMFYHCSLTEEQYQKLTKNSLEQ